MQLVVYAIAAIVSLWVLITLAVGAAGMARSVYWAFRKNDENIRVKCGDLGRYSRPSTTRFEGVCVVIMLVVVVLFFCCINVLPD